MSPKKPHRNTRPRQARLITTKAKYPNPEKGIRSCRTDEEQIKGTMFEKEEDDGQEDLFEGKEEEVKAKIKER